jgi:hypothetical protein
MIYSEILRYKAKVKNYDITEDVINTRLKKYRDNLLTSLYEKKFIDIKDLKINNNKIEDRYSSLAYIDKSEMINFLISGGLQFAFPVNTENEVLSNVDKILVLLEAINNKLIPASSKVLCYIVDENNTIETKNSFDVLIPKNYYELLFFKDFYFNLLSEKQITEEIRTFSDDFNFKDQFIKINKNRYEILENYPYLTDEYIFFLYKKGQLNIKKFPIKDILKK